MITTKLKGGAKMQSEGVTLLIIFLPFFVIFLILAGVNRSARRNYIDELREKVKALPLDDKIRQQRLENFDRIVEKVMDYKVKIRLLEKLASGEDVKPLKKKKKLFKPLKDDDLKVVTQQKMISWGWLPSGITAQCKFLPASEITES